MDDIVRSGYFWSVTDLVADRLGQLFRENVISGRAWVMVLRPPDILGGDGRRLLRAIWRLYAGPTPLRSLSVPLCVPGGQLVSSGLFP